MPQLRRFAPEKILTLEGRFLGLQVLGLVDSRELKPVADEAQARLERVAKALGG